MPTFKETDSRQTRIEVMQDRLTIAVEYAQTFRSSVDPDGVEACEKAIRYADMLSRAILALAVDPETV